MAVFEPTDTSALEAEWMTRILTNGGFASDPSRFVQIRMKQDRLLWHKELDPASQIRTQ